MENIKKYLKFHGEVRCDWTGKCCVHLFNVQFENLFWYLLFHFDFPFLEAAILIITDFIATLE